MRCRGRAVPSRRCTDDSYWVSIKRTNQLRLSRRSLRSRWRLCRLTDAACPLRVVSAFGSCRFPGIFGERTGFQVCHCEEAGGRRGNLAVPGCIVGKLPAKSQLPSRDCRVASLLAMTHQAGAAVTTVHPIKLVLLIAASRTGMAVPAPTLICETARNEISIHEQNKL